MKSIIIWAISICAVVVAAFGIRYGSIFATVAGTYTDVSVMAEGINVSEERDEIRIYPEFSLSIDDIGLGYKDENFKGDCTKGDKTLTLIPQKGRNEAAQKVIDILKKDGITIPSKTYDIHGSYLVDKSVAVECEVEIGTFVSGEHTYFKMTICFSSMQHEKYTLEDAYLTLYDNGTCEYMGSCILEDGQRAIYKYAGTYESEEGVLLMTLTKGEVKSSSGTAKFDGSCQAAMYINSGNVYPNVYKD